VVTASRVAYFDLLGHGRSTQGSVPASNAPTCPDDIFGKRNVNIRLNPGIFIGHVDDSGAQCLEEIWLDDRPADDDWSPCAGRPFAELDPVTASELLAELAEARS
jgi:hypothetical protein